MHKALPLMIQGTASTCGKSLITAALCRIFRQDGYRVAPFKAQNMSNNSFVTRDGLEIGRAQAVQAFAAGVEPEVRMNPVLIKPSSDTGAQVVLCGKPAFVMDAKNWHATRNRLRDTIRSSWESLVADYEIIVLEGAGSPAEINLKKNDVVNMGMAKMADSPVIIVGDIDRGGVFASLVGTVQLLDPDERARVKGFIINKFRGDRSLLTPGLEQLEALTGVPVLGVVPWIDHAIDDEDGVSERFLSTTPTGDDIDICIIRLPQLSNFTDFLPLERIPGVTVRWCDKKEVLGTPDLLILPGTKATIVDLRKCKSAGIAGAICTYAQQGGTVLGICGGFQMLGNAIDDPEHAESASGGEAGLGLLDMTTSFHARKTTIQTSAVINGKHSWLLEKIDGSLAEGYEIHHGMSVFDVAALPFTQSRERDGTWRTTGITDTTGHILGTYLHGLFDSGPLTTGIVNAILRKKGLPLLDHAVVDRRNVLESELDGLAAIVRESVDMENMLRIIGKK